MLVLLCSIALPIYPNRKSKIETGTSPLSMEKNRKILSSDPLFDPSAERTTRGLLLVLYIGLWLGGSVTWSWRRRGLTWIRASTV
jgi:hypothetical protein